MIRRYWWAAGLFLAVAVVIVLAPLASSDPDGLERVAIDAGFVDTGQEATYELLPDYSVPFLGDGPLSLIVAGLIGVALIFGAMWLLGRVLARRTQATD
jgi:cobalt/nickel transport system permease protein